MSKEKRQYFVKLEIEEPAPFYMDVHQPATVLNLIKYFGSSRFYRDRHITQILSFLNGSESMGCKMIDYKNSNHVADSSNYVEFHIEVPAEKVDEFELEYDRYFDNS